ncbi:MAG: hypothetical protein ABSH56_10575 [Bryobacteraceae bacterium]
MLDIRLANMMDFRVPLGRYFAMGVMVAGTGALGAGARAVIARANEDLHCGLIMFAFGGFWRIPKQS